MAYGKIVEMNEKGALVLFENSGIQKRVKISRHVLQDIQPGSEVVVIFETDMINGIIIGVV